MMTMTVIEIYGKIRGLRSQGDLLGADKLLTEWAAETGKPEDKWHAVSVLFTFALGEGLLDAAAVYANQLLQMDPKDPYAHSCMGMVHKLNGDLTNAEEEFNQAMSIADEIDDPNLLSYTTDLADVLLRQGKLDESEALVVNDVELQVMEEDTTDIVALVSRLRLLSKLYKAKGNYDKSADYLRQALRAIAQSKILFIGHADLLEELVSVIKYDTNY